MTKIAWTDASWNPVIGCSKVSAGCQNCYAEKMAYRLKMMGQSKYFSVVDTFRGEHLWTNKIYCDESALDKPLHWRKPRRIFVCSMGDLFHPAVNAEFLIRVLNTIGGCQQHTFQILTKRPEQMLKVMNLYYQTADMVPKKFRTMTPYPNLWLGVSVENQKTADERIPILLQIPAAVRFVSVEPMLEAINLLDLNGIMAMGGIYGAYLDWVIIGCESGPKRRECKIEWVRDLVSQCDAANIPVFVKQLSINGKVEHDIKKFPKDLRIRQWPIR